MPNDWSAPTGKVAATAGGLIGRSMTFIPHCRFASTRDDRDVWRPFDRIGGLERADIAAKEWIGLVAYYLTGRIADLFPEPATSARVADPQTRWGLSSPGSPSSFEELPRRRLLNVAALPAVTEQEAKAVCQTLGPEGEALKCAVARE